jgi:predicted nucleic acid-binding protein
MQPNRQRTYREIDGAWCQSRNVNEQLTTLARAAEWVEVPEEKIEDILSDPDDNVVVACAVEGNANYLLTYDPHFDSLQGDYKGIKIVKAIPFLEVLRRNEE